jgi:serine/threonine protein phosphatase PrpC
VIRIRVKNFDVESLSLSAEEGFVLSRVTGSLSMTELVALSGIEADRLTVIVERLASQGVLDLTVESSNDTVPAPSLEELEELEEVKDEVAGGVAIAVCGISDVGVARSNNEDAFAVVDLTTGDLVEASATGMLVVTGDRGILFAVSDGMGGENAGEVASALVLETVRAHLGANLESADPAASLAAAVVEANRRVADAGSAPDRSGMGATLVALLVHGGTAITAEVGDSRAYVLRSGTLSPITKDQTHIQMLIDQGLLTPEQAKTSRAKNVVIQACGKASEVVVAQRRFELREGDRLLLCSDGLTSHLADPEIAAILKGVDSSEGACAKLVSLANERGGKDNITVLLADVAGPLPPPAPGETVGSTLVALREFSVGG